MRLPMRSLFALTILSAGFPTLVGLTGCNEAAKVDTATSDKALPEAAEPPGEAAATGTDPTGAESKVASSSASAPPAAAAGKIDVQLANHSQLLERIAAHKGRVVVVDVWSTSCLPCMKEFPHLVELARRWPEDVVCISMNVDYIGLAAKKPESYVPKVTEFLTSTKADPANLIHIVSSEPDSDVLTKFDVEAMPAIFVFDRAGQQSAKLTTNNAGDDGLTYAGDVVPLVEKLIQ